MNFALALSGSKHTGADCISYGKKAWKKNLILHSREWEEPTHVHNTSRDGREWISLITQTKNLLGSLSLCLHPVSVPENLLDWEHWL